MRSCLAVVVALAASVGTPATGVAQVGVGPQAETPAPAIAEPRDQAFRGTLTLAVDATDTDHQIFTVHETIPVQTTGRVTLRYLEWETGSHAPTGSVIELAGLVIRVDGRRPEWHRDPVDLHAFHLDVPAGARTIAVELQFLAPSSAAVLRPDLVEVQWQRMLLYPAGWYVRDIPVAARLTLPHGLHAFTALAAAHADADTLSFEPVTLDALVDAPVYAGRFWRQLDLAPGAAAPVRLDLVADALESLAVPAGELGRLRALVVQTARVFGSGPYRHYDAIVSLSDVLSPGGGIEHLQEGENNLPAAYFTDLAHQLGNRDLIAHEYVHAWNGRFRQPADLWSPDFNHPQGGSLLWVYEGQTEFWGRVLAARAGLRSRQDTLDRLAIDAALVANRPGRAWKSLADSDSDAIYMAGHPVGWRDWQRREDYYAEGVLLWLDIDARLRARSGGRLGLDDVAHRFFATGSGQHATMTYRFADVCAALHAVRPDDWAGILRTHLDSHRDADALAGLAHAGWRLVYADVPSESFRQDEADTGVSNLDYSIGLQVRKTGAVRSVAWDSPAFRAGMAPGLRITAVNGQAFTPAALEAGVKAAGSAPLVLTVDADGRSRTMAVSYAGTLRYPRLERIPGSPDWLAILLATGP